jgi:hypothetical protein
LGVDGGAEMTAAKGLVVGVAFGQFGELVSQQWPFRKSQ